MFYNLSPPISWLRLILVFIFAISIYNFFLPGLIFLAGCVSIITTLLIWRWVISCAAKLFQRQKLGKMITAQGTMMECGNLYKRGAVTSIVAMKLESPTLDVQVLRNKVEQKWLSAKLPGSNDLLYPELKSGVRQWMGYLFWKPCQHFDIEDHVKYIKNADVAENWDDVCTEAGFKNLFMHILRDRLWVEGKPLWEMIIVDKSCFKNMENLDNKSWIFFRYHHMMADGWSMFKLWSKLFDEDDILEKVPRPIFHGERTTLWTRFISSVQFYLKMPFEVVDLMLNILANPDTLPTFPVVGGSCDVKLEMRNGPSLQSLKQLKNDLGVDLQSLLLAGMTASIRQSYQKAGRPPPENIKLFFILPMLGHPDKLQNHLTFCCIFLPIGESDSMKRIQVIASRIQRFKRSGLPLALFLGSRVYGSMPVPLLRRFIVSTPLLFTNLIGPLSTVHCEGKPISSICGISNPPDDGTDRFECGMAFLSHSGTTHLQVIGMSKYFCDNQHPEEYLDRCIQEWEELEIMMPS
ncbi:O-acyltransferase WSD-like isoform X2 [Folsomia candida]|uniref:O-acyltransferase WSD-like isoform X2 n=1 Tax=Folsomia candida TaxID=158441 RepID=UPI001605074C|nr:O-acyltransferase WSD-like isoform X2 [Folsomia candida]XP_035702161.1 O-acyltransferase WSD-like isoform X2 [Folsomia candida]XP_035702162.1 O-acyltransferase WSD-like isoform X2 [Folsomia candida]